MGFFGDDVDEESEASAFAAFLLFLARSERLSHAYDVRYFLLDPVMVVLRDFGVMILSSSVSVLSSSEIAFFFRGLSSSTSSSSPKGSGPSS